MSYTNLVFFVDGKAVDGIERRNSWGGSAAIWIYLARTRLGLGDACYGTEHWERVWPLAGDPAQPKSERIANAFACDNAIVKRRDFARLSAAFREVGRCIREVFPNAACHLPDWADEIDADEKSDAVALYATSVGENPWLIEVPCETCGCTCDGETRPYDLCRDTGHWDVFERLGLGISQTDEAKRRQETTTE